MMISSLNLSIINIYYKDPLSIITIRIELRRGFQVPVIIIKACKKPYDKTRTVFMQVCIA